MFNFTPLRDKILQMVINNPVPYRNTDVRNPYFVLGINLFFTKYKSVVMNELYYKGLIELHGDVNLFIKAKSASQTRYLRVEASVTPKGMSYYQTNVLKTVPETEQESIQADFNRPKLSIVR